MKHTKIILTAGAMFFLFSCTEKSVDTNDPLPAVDPAEMLSGGETTIHLASSQSFSTPAANLSSASLTEHLLGDLNFEQNFVKAPAPVNSGLGPLFNNVSCINCHSSDGRGTPILDGNELESFLIRISINGTDPHGGPNPVPGFGGQLQTQSIFGYEAEGKVQIVYSEIGGIYPDGTTYSLREPEYIISGQVPGGINISPRVAPAVFGVGLLEAINEADILALADENDINGDEISGKPNYVWDDGSGSVKMGRFGWKANQPNLLQQTAAAYVNDMGVTNPLYKMESCYNNAECDTLSDDPEIDEEILNSVEFYVQTLGVPARRNFDEPEVLRGKELFNNIGCASCHTPEFTTGTHEIAELSNQRIFPYTDMLLHDMGEGLADNRPDFLADGFEWRTTPLWGIGLINVVNGHTFFLHDGRARNLEEAILWHGGEGEISKNNFMNLSKSDREKVIKFLNSL